MSTGGLAWRHSVAWAKRTLRVQVETGDIDDWYELALAIGFGLDVPGAPLARAYDLLARSMAGGADGAIVRPAGEGRARSATRGAGLAVVENLLEVVKVVALAGMLEGPLCGQLAAWLRSLARPDGRYADETSPLASAPHSDLEDTWSAVDTLTALGEPTVREETVRWVLALQSADGSFRAPPPQQVTAPYGSVFADTLAAVRILDRARVVPRDRDACVTWLLAQRDEVWAGGVVAWWQLASALFALGALTRIEPELAAHLGGLRLDEPERSRVGFATYAAFQCIAMLGEARRAGAEQR